MISYFRIDKYAEAEDIIKNSKMFLIYGFLASILLGVCSFFIVKYFLIFIEYVIFCSGYNVEIDRFSFLAFIGALHMFFIINFESYQELCEAKRYIRSYKDHKDCEDSKID